MSKEKSVVTLAPSGLAALDRMFAGKAKRPIRIVRLGGG